MRPFLEGTIIGVASVLLTSTRALASQHVTGDCSGNRLNKSAVCGVEVEGQCEENNREDEVRVLCESDVSCGFSNVRNMA